MIFNDLDEIRKCTRPSDWWTKYFLHPFSTRLVSLVRGTRISPDHLTLMAAALVILAFPLICWGNYFSAVLAALILQLSLTLDCADGQLARVRNAGSVFGEWLDRSTDRVKEFLIIFAFVFRYSKTDANAWMPGFACLFIVYFLDFLGLQDRFSPILPAKEGAIDEKESGIIRKLKELKRRAGLNFFQIGEQYFLYSLFLVLDKVNWLFYFIIGYGSVAIGWFVFNTCREARLLKKRANG